MKYKDAGVDINAGLRVVDKIKKTVRETFSNKVVGKFGGFGGMFELKEKGIKDIVLVSSVDGVGTKLKIAFMLNKHDTVGQDLVNHCVNDILVQGATPLFFMDYIAMEKLNPDKISLIIKGMANACKKNECVLLGGETAEMPDFYSKGEYDIAGFIVGVVEKSKIIDGMKIKPGAVVMGLSSSGLHTNGYSLARHIFFDILGYSVNTNVPELGGTVGNILLRFHRSYLKVLKPILESGKILGLAHITGGGFIDNIPRVLSDGCCVEIYKNSWKVPKIFKFLQDKGKISEREMFRTFNMGIGMVIFANEHDAGWVYSRIKAQGEEAKIIGRVVKGEREVRLV